MPATILAMAYYSTDREREREREREQSMEALFILVLTLIIVFVIHVCCKRRSTSSSTPIMLVTDGLGNEIIVTEVRIGNRQMQFMIDTAFAGAPVISTSYLVQLYGPLAVAQDRVDPAVQTRYVDITSNLNVTEDARHAALSHFLAQSGCRMYTSGCTMRLMGIAETTESQSDLLLCDTFFMLHDRHMWRRTSEVLVTNPLHSSIHILTIDFLLHRSPCVLLPGRRRILWRVSDSWLRSTFVFVSSVFVGGALRVPMIVGGTELQIVIDTGAAAALSISAAAIDKIQRCELFDLPRRALQTGVNGERVCSDAFVARVSIGSVDMGEVETFANSQSVQGADGYAGMGLLRALDIWLSPSDVGFRRSGLEVRRSNALSDGACKQGKRLACARQQ
jgi:hypothetical protein